VGDVLYSNIGSETRLDDRFHESCQLS
jgi:hypothetical protein